MVGRYSINHPNIVQGISEASIAKNVTLQVRDINLSKISKCVERTTDLKTLERIKYNVFNECYIDLTLDKLRELDSDKNLQDQYILSRSKFLDRGMVNVLMLKLRLGVGEQLTNDDYDYINSLLQWPHNDIYVMPILEFSDGVGRIERFEYYNDFVKRMLSEKSSWFTSDVNVGMSIPNFVPRRYVNPLIELYDDEKPTFVAVDFNNGRMDKPSNVVGTVLKHFRTEHEENTFLYGVNVKPYKRGQANTSAWDIYMVHGSFNAIGPTHSKARPMNLPSDWSTIGRIFDDTDIKYDVVDNAHCKLFIDWMESSYGEIIDPDFNKNHKGLYAYLKRYNYEKANGVLSDISRAIDNSETEYITKVIELMPEEVKHTSIIGNDTKKRKARK